MRLCLILAALALVACPNKPPAPPDLVDAGEDGGEDAGSDAGVDAGLRPQDECSLAAQDCDAGSCIQISLDGGGIAAACRAGACDLVKQDCPAGEKCTYVIDAGTFLRGCAAEGTGEEGQACTGTPSSNTCKKGLICVSGELGDGGASSVCNRFCNSSAECTAPRHCFLLVEISGSEERPLVCAEPPPACDPLAQDCVKSTDGCFPSSIGPTCFPAGNVSDGSPCTFANDCQKGSICVDNSRTCRAICRFPSGNPSCASGTCTRLAGSTDAGVCL